MKPSERIPHDPQCNTVNKPSVEPNECDCWVSEVAQLEEKIKGLEYDIGVEFTNSLRVGERNTQLEAKLMDIECAGCAKTMLECECDA